MRKVNFKRRFTHSILILSIGFSLFIVHESTAQTGSVAEPVRYVGGVTIDPNLHEGRLRYAVGTENIQVLRANRTHPEYAEDYGWTYNHAPNLAYWNDMFFLQYLSNPKDEHVAPGHTLLVTSEDGRNWNKPKVVFPPYEAPEGVAIPEGYNGYMMHQRMGFFVAPNGKLLVLGFYGHTDHPFGEGGIGRVVREVKQDGSFGSIYFLRYSSFTDFDESNTSFPNYKTSDDSEFVAACDALLTDRLKTLQWLDEDYGKDDFYGEGKVADSVEAFSYYHRPDGKVLGLWKWSIAAISDDEGQTFSDPVKCNTLLMAGGKQWGQMTDDGRYAIAYNPIEQQEYRFPLITITSDDGEVYDDMLLVHGEVPVRRFFGRWKDFGPCYVRGIVEGNGNPPGDDMWLTYSVNKEDIWISRIPLTVKYAVKGKVKDSFEDITVGGIITDWNRYAPVWAPVAVVADGDNHVLELRDKDPYDYARAIRVFKEGEKAKLSFEVTPKQNDFGTLQIEVTDRYGNRPVQIHFTEEGQIQAYDGAELVNIGSYKAGQEYAFRLNVNATVSGSYSLWIDGNQVLNNAALAMAVKSVERISFRTGAYRNNPTRKTPNQKQMDPLKGTDDPEKESVYWIDDVVLSAQ